MSPTNHSYATSDAVGVRLLRRDRPSEPDQNRRRRADEDGTPAGGWSSDTRDDARVDARRVNGSGVEQLWRTVVVRQRDV